MSQLWANLGTGGTALDARNGSGTGVDSNDAKLLEHDGTNYVYLPGVAGNYMSVPDEAALDITGDIEIVWRGSLDAFGQQYLVNKNGTATNGGYALMVLSAGQLAFRWSNGTSTLTTQAGQTIAAAGLATSTVYWWKGTLDVDNGSAQHQVRLYWAADSATEPTVWNQFTAPAAGAGVTSIANSATALAIGAWHSGTTDVVAGSVYRAIVRNGIGGTTVLDVDTSVITSGAATSFTATTGQTVTISRSTSGRKSVAVVNDVWLLGMANYLEIADNDLLDFGASDSFTVVAVLRQWATPASGTPIVAKQTGTLSNGGYRLVCSTSGNYRFDISDTVNNDTAPIVAGALGTLHVLTGTRNVAADTIATGVGTSVSASTDDTTGSLATATALTIGRFSSATYSDMELMAVAVFRRALTAGEIAALSTYYATRFP